MPRILLRTNHIHFVFQLWDISYNRTKFSHEHFHFGINSQVDVPRSLQHFQVCYLTPISPKMTLTFYSVTLYLKSISGYIQGTFALNCSYSRSKMTSGYIKGILWKRFPLLLVKFLLDHLNHYNKIHNQCICCNLS